MLSHLLSDKIVNNGRQHAFDLCKTISIILMILCHVFYAMNYSVSISLNPVYIGHNAVRLLGAQCFMFSMGLGLAYSRNTSAKYCAKRGCKLILLGYILNFLCIVLPWMIIGESHIFGTFVDNKFLMGLCGDILQFAGLSMLFFAIVKYFKWSDLTTFIITLCITAIGTFCNDKIYFVLTPEHFYYSFVGLLVPVKNFITAEYVCFSFCNWIIYPVVGWLFGKILKRCTDLNKIYLYLLGISTSLFFVIWKIFSLMGKNIWLILMDPVVYHQQSPLFLIIYMDIIMIALSFAHFISIHLTKYRIWSVVKNLSEELLTLYIVSWIVIGWFSAVLKYTNTSINYSWSNVFYVFVFVFLTSEIYIYLKNKFERYKLTPNT